MRLKFLSSESKSTEDTISSALRRAQKGENRRSDREQFLSDGLIWVLGGLSDRPNSLASDLQHPQDIAENREGHAQRRISRVQYGLFDTIGTRKR